MSVSQGNRLKIGVSGISEQVFIWSSLVQLGPLGVQAVSRTMQKCSDGFGGFRLHSGHDVAVGVHGQSGAGVAEAVGDYLGVGAVHQ